MKKVDLSDLKVGDKAWSAMHGEVIFIEKEYLIEVSSEQGLHLFYKDGNCNIKDIHPTLFHSEQEFREYWGMESNQLTKREQFAMAAMQGLVFLGHGINKAAEFSVLHADALLTKLNEKP
jgi:hypothetical protein